MSPKLPIPPLGPVPRWLTLGILLLAAASFIPIALIARERATRVDRPRLQIIPDMDQQPRFKAQQANALFADGRAARPPVPGTVPVGHARLDDHLYRGVAGGTWAESFPFTLTPEVVQRGRERYGIYCAMCHGLSGAGDGIVHARALRLQEGTWTPPSNLHDQVVVERPVEHLFNTITNGIRNMPAYGSQLPERDRWAIVAYVRALQRSQRAPVEDVPTEMRDQLR